MTPVAVTFEYDANGIVKVTCHQQGGSTRTVALSTSHSGQNVKNQLAPVSPLLRRVQALLQKMKLSAEELAQVESSQAALSSSDQEIREAAEEQLLDLLLEHEED
jgi:molecular chaperone DnaK (HSP70)